MRKTRAERMPAAQQEKEIIERGGGGNCPNNDEEHNSVLALTRIRNHRRARNSDYITTGQAAYLLGVSNATVRLLFNKQILTGFRLGRTVRIKVESIRQFLASNSNVAKPKEGE